MPSWGWFSHKRHESTEWAGFLEQGVRVDGELETTGLFRIDSHMQGTLVSKDTLILGAHAAVEGEIIGNEVVIWGRFDGTIRASTRVEIQPKAIVTGDIHSPCLIIEPGAVFDGHCYVLAPHTEPAKPMVIPIRSGVRPA